MRTPALVVLLLCLACASDGGNAPAPEPTPSGARLSDVSTTLPGAVGAGRSMEARAVDVDGDGDLDLFVAREFEINRLLINDGTGRFTDETAARLEPLVHDHEDVAVGDLDRDGDVDLVVVSEDDAPGLGARKHELLLNDGTGHFTEAAGRLPATVANAVTAGDVDGDGDLDLVLGNAGPELLLLNDGTAHFTVAGPERLPPLANVTQDVMLADVDRDGDLDLVVANDDGTGSLLYRNDGQGTFMTDPSAIPGRATTEVTRNVDLADVDDDGDLDLMLANINAGAEPDPANRLLLNDGTGRFTPAAAGALPSLAQSTFDADFSDIDGDGDPDLVLALFGSTGGGLRVWLNDGAGRFSSTASAWVAPSTWGPGVEVEVADLSGDGRPDVYYATYEGAGDRLLLQVPDP